MRGSTAWNRRTSACVRSLRSSDGLELHYFAVSFSKIRYSLFNDRGPWGNALSPATYDTLLHRDYIHIVSTNSAGHGVCRITDKGRAAIAEVTT